MPDPARAVRAAWRRPAWQRSPVQVRVEQGQLELQAQAARAEAGGVDGAEAAGGRDERGIAVGISGREAGEQPVPERVDDLVEEHPQVAPAILEPVEQRDARRRVADRPAR